MHAEKKIKNLISRDKKISEQCLLFKNERNIKYSYQEWLTHVDWTFRFFSQYLKLNP